MCFVQWQFGVVIGSRCCRQRELFVPEACHRRGVDATPGDCSSRERDSLLDLFGTQQHPEEAYT